MLYFEKLTADEGGSHSPSSRFQEQSPPPRPEAYPIPTQTYAREYFTFPASKSQDRVAPPQHQWADYEEKPRTHVDGSHSSITVQVRGAASRHASALDVGPARAVSGGAKAHGV